MIQKRPNLEAIKLYLDVILTATEVKKLITRINIIHYLQQAKTQKWIANELKCSVQTVNRISKQLKY
jgi:Trp operon repressor